MKPNTHHHVTTVAVILIALSAAGLILLFQDQISALGINFTFTLVGAFVVASVLFQSLVAPRIPADCPRCGGSSYLKGYKKYRCTRCGHVEDVHPWSQTGSIGRKIHHTAKRDKNKTE